MEERVFLLHTKIRRNSDTSPGKPPRRVALGHSSGLLYQMPAAFAGGGAHLPGFSLPPLPQRLVLTRSRQTLSLHRASRAELEGSWCRHSPGGARESPVGWPDPEHEAEEGRSPGCRIAVRVSVNHSAHQDSS